MLRSGQKWSLASRADRGLRCTLGKTSAPFGATHARGEGARPERSGIQSVAVGGSPSIKYDESHHTAPELEDRHADRPRVRSRPRYSPPPHTAAIVGHVGSFPDLIPHIPADRTATGVRVKTAARPRRCRSDLRSGSPTPYPCDVGTVTVDRYVRGPVTYAHRAAQPLRARCTRSTRDSPRSSCVARRGRAPARRTADRLRTSRPRCRTRGRTYLPVTGFPDGTGTRPSAVLSRPKPGARVCRVDQWKRAREWNSYR